MKTYESFEVWIEPAIGGQGNSGMPTYPVRVYHSPAGPADGRLVLDVNASSFTKQLSLVRGKDPDLKGRQTFGQTLFDALFQGKVLAVWNTSYGSIARGQASGMRLRLCINAPELAALPWELLYEKERDSFLATDATVAVARYLPVREPPYLPAQEKLRILIVVQSPEGGIQIEPEEVTKLKTALDNLGQKVEYNCLPWNAGISVIQDELQKKEYHVFHFLGHGDAGLLAMTAEGGNKQLTISDREFAQLFLGRRSIRLVVLNACYSSQPKNELSNLFAGIGPALVQKQLPAVVAMQYHSVYLETASKFSRALYGALANGIPVDFAVNEARQQISIGNLLSQRDWSTPVLYMGTQNGHILDLIGQETDQERQWQPVLAMAEQSGTAKAALLDMASRHRDLGVLMSLSNYLVEVRTDFVPCAQIVAPARFNPSSLRFNELLPVWKRVQKDRLVPIRVFLDSHSEVNASAWWPALEKKVGIIDKAFDAVELKKLTENMLAFDSQLTNAEAFVRQQRDSAIADLVALSDRTLGRLSAI